jgi:hypothetical protein
MAAHGNTTVWGTHSDIGRVRSGTRWYKQLRDWWKAHKRASQEVGFASLDRCWDAKREVYKPLRAEAAMEMAIAHGILSIATQPYSLIQ